MPNRPRNRRYENNSPPAASNKPSAASDGGRLTALNWAAYLRRRLRSLAVPFKAARGRRAVKAKADGRDLPGRLLKAGATFFTVAVVVVITTVLLSEVFNGNKVVIKPFLVSPELKGIYDEQIVAHLIKHNISVMMYEAKSVKTSMAFDLPVSARLPDVQVPASNISARSLIRYLQEFAPLRYFKRLIGLNSIEVDGEALLRGDKVTINLRLTKDVNGVSVVEPETFTGNRENIEPLIAEVSQFIMAYAEPYVWAAYLYQKKRTEEALAQVQYCLRKEPAESKHLALALWGLILIDQGKYEEAIAKLREATTNVPAGQGQERELATAYNNWGLALVYKCETEDAISKFKEAISHDPNHAYAYNNYGKAFFDMWEAKDDEGEKKKGIEKLEQALRLDPNLATAYFNLAYAQHDESPYDAIALYLTAIKLDPEYVDAYSGLGLVLGDVISPTRPEEALAKLDRAIELDPSFAPAYANRALAWASKKEYKRAIVDLEAAVERYKHLPDPRRGCRNFPKRYARAYNNLGWVYEEDENYKSAVANYQKAIELDPDYYYAYVGKGDALRKMGRFDEALAACETVIQEVKADEESRFAAYEGKGLALFERARGHAPADRRRDLELSISMFNEALKLKPGSKDVQDELSQAMSALGSLPKKPN